MSRILEQWTAGRGCPDTLVIDGHIHIGEWPHATTFNNVDQAAKESISFMDSNGVDAICAVSGGYMFGKSDYHLGNDFLLAVWQKTGDRLIPFMSINPNDTTENILDELARMNRAGVHCIKLLNGYQGYPGDGPNLLVLYKFASQHGMLVFNHLWSENEISFIASQFPEVDFVFGHYIGGFQDEIMLTHPNVYSNIWAYSSLNFLDHGIAKVGANKFMLGSDGFLNSLSVGIGPVVFSRQMNDDDKRLVLGLNVAQLLDKVQALPSSLKQKY